MKTAKLVIGILSIVLTMVVLFQSCAATVGRWQMKEEPAVVWEWLWHC